MTLPTLYQFVSVLTRPVRYHSETVLDTDMARLGAPERGAGSPNGLTEGFYRSRDRETPPVSLTLNHLPLPGEAWALRAANNVTEKTKEDSTETSILPALAWTKIFFRR